MEDVSEAHESEYGARPDVVAVAPGRFHLMGEHTWFFKDKTLSMAVDMPVYVAVSRRADANARFFFVQLRERRRTSLAALKVRREDKWANAIKAVISGFEGEGFACGGLNFTVHSAIPPAAGFGITTAMKVAAAWALRELYGFACDDGRLLAVLDRANRQFLQQDGFLADNFAAVYSREGSLVLTDHARAACDVIPFPFKSHTVILTDARVPRIATWNEAGLQQPENVLLLGELKERRASVYGGWCYEENRAEVNEVLSVVGEDVRRRLTCIMGEHKCLLEAESALEKADFASFARAVNRSHRNMRDLYDISSPEVDWLLKRVQELDEEPDDLRTPVNCGRITGRGYGRSTYTILRSSDVDKYRGKLVEYERIFGFSPSCHTVHPAGGVRLV